MDVLYHALLDCYVSRSRADALEVIVTFKFYLTHDKVKRSRLKIPYTQTTKYAKLFVPDCVCVSAIRLSCSRHRSSPLPSTTVSRRGAHRPPARRTRSAVLRPVLRTIVYWHVDMYAGKVLVYWHV